MQLNPLIHRMPVRQVMLRGVALLAVLAGCEHSEPFAVTPPDPLGPRDLGDVRRITFNPGEDRAPFVIADSLIVFTRVEPNRSDRDRCLAHLPVEGGTLLRTMCPGGIAPDTMLDAWLFPAASSGGRLGFLWQEGRITSFAPGIRTLTVGRVAAPDSIEFEANMLFELFGAQANSMRRLLWVSDSRLRFVAGLETFPLVNNQRDTAFAALGMADLAVENGTVSEVPGGQGIFAYATPHDAGFWAVSLEDPRELLRLDAGIRTVVGRFSGAVIDVANVGGLPVGAVAFGGVVEWLDLETGQPMGRVLVPGTIRRISSAGGRRLVAEVESGSGRDLWLITLP